MSGSQFNIESVFRCGEGVIIVGWITDHCNTATKITLKQGNQPSHTFDLSKDTITLRTARHDVNNAFDISIAEAEKLGIIIWAPYAGNIEQELSIHFDSLTALAQSKKISLLQKENHFLESAYSHSGNLLQEIAIEKNDVPLIFALKKTQEKLMPGTKESNSEHPRLGGCALDYVFDIAGKGLLLIGWNHFINGTPLAIEIISSSGNAFPVTQTFTNSRPDVAQHLKQTYPDISPNCGFIYYIDLPTDEHEQYALRYKFEQGDIWVNTNIQRQGNDPKFIQKVLQSIPNAHQLMDSIYAIYNSGFGRAIEVFSRKNRINVTTYSERQFGKPPLNPKVSIIIPLYGRYDFMRHQLAQFVSDPDFDTADLIYVVDDPQIIDQSIAYATAHHGIFGKPFRVVWYSCNLGFAGANNIGVRAAKSTNLLLMNSDVIPQCSGWVSELLNAHATLPDAGIVAPLLQFADNSIQHAGMRATRNAYLPGFLLNTHPGKGWKYTHTKEPSEEQLITAACILLSKNDYLSVGGFDEGYLIGDFEDSDLCMAIKKSGKKNWLIPAVKLWHLERQSQNIGTISGFRQLITLYNGWRYHEKIVRGEIANPEIEVSAQ
jgi:GT2 family glycosyltransferase